MTNLSIHGMTCGHCARAVTQALSKVPGVVRVHEVNVSRGEALVEGTASADALVVAVHAAGYEAQVISTGEPG